MEAFTWGWIHGRRGTIGDARFPAWRHEEAGPRVKSRPVGRWGDGEMVEMMAHGIREGGECMGYIVLVAACYGM